MYIIKLIWSMLEELWYIMTHSRILMLLLYGIIALGIIMVFYAALDQVSLVIDRINNIRY